MGGGGVCVISWVMYCLEDDFEGFMYHLVKVREKGSSIDQLQRFSCFVKIDLNSV